MPQHTSGDLSGYYLEDSIVNALDNSVQRSVNKALAVALEPLTKRLHQFAMCLKSESPAALGGAPQPMKADVKSDEWPHVQALAKLVKDCVNDHGYCAGLAPQGKPAKRHATDTDSDQSNGADPDTASGSKPQKADQHFTEAIDLTVNPLSC